MSILYRLTFVLSRSSTAGFRSCFHRIEDSPAVSGLTFVQMVHTFIKQSLHKVEFNKNNMACAVHQQVCSEQLPPALDNVPQYIHLSEDLQKEAASFKQELLQSMIVHEDFLSTEDEHDILDETEPYLKRMHYEFAHWDDAIHGFRETERLNWNTENQVTLNRVRKLAFPPNVNQLKYVHILDLDEKGYIKPHIDAIRFCGDTIAGLSLLTNSVMRLVHDKRKSIFMDVLLKRRSLYIMKDTARFDYTHEILKNDESFFKNEKVPKGRRISVICRNEPDPENIK